MPIVDMRDMLNHAYRNSYAIGGFEVHNLEFLAAIIHAAEDCRAPVILNIVAFHLHDDDVELVAAAAEAAAQRTTIPVAIHMDHTHARDQVVRAINRGCNSVMIGASHDTFPNNVAITRDIVELAHSCGITVEGEVGYDAGMVHADNPASAHGMQYTSVEEAKAFVLRTGVDCLAVSIGTQHGRVSGRTKLDTDRLKRINDAVKIPLVIHGGSGLQDDQYRKLVAHGVARINYSTALSEIAAEQQRKNLRQQSGAGYAQLHQGVRESLQNEITRCLKLWGSAGRAAEVLMQCRPWTPVQHVIVYNVDGANDEQITRMMNHGRTLLARIPGVRQVFTGWAVNLNARYRCCWLVEFAHPKVIDSYRDHPDHIAFANQLFRPIAGDRISIDFSQDIGVVAANATTNAPLAVG